MIHLCLKFTKPNLCGARESVPDLRTDAGHVRAVGRDRVRVWAHPRATDIAIAPDEAAVGLLLDEKTVAVGQVSEPPVRTIVAQEKICPKCMLLYTFMTANGTTSMTTAKALLKRAGELK